MPETPDNNPGLTLVSGFALCIMLEVWGYVFLGDLGVLAVGTVLAAIALIGPLRGDR